MNRKGSFSLFLLVLGLLTGQLFGQVKLQNAQSAEDVPEAFRALWQKGDWIVSDGAFLALIGGPGRLRISEQKGRLAELVVQDFLNSAVLYRDFLKDTPQLTLPLPEGAYLVTANLFPAVVEGRLMVTPDGENTCALTDPPRGKVGVKIQDGQGRHVPGKVIFIGLQPTRTPYFEPENPRQTEQGWETFKNSCYPPEQGQEVVLPAGVYLASASRGPESTSDQKVIEVLQDSVQELIFRLDRVLDTPGLIALDPHLHTTLPEPLELKKEVPVQQEKVSRN